MSLHLDLSRFDGKGLAVLQDIKANTPASPVLFDALVDIMGGDDKHMQTGASWLLRAYLEEGARLSGAQTARLADVLSAMYDGFGRLHVCQAMEHMQVPEEHAAAFADFFRGCAASKNTFLRAWAPHGFFELALVHVVYAEEAQAMVQKALADPAPSVRARARRTLAGE